MSNIAIEFDGVGKQYRLGRVGTGTLSHDLNRWWQTTILRREDPYLRIGETNDRTTKGNSDYVWALKDISFKVEQGDVVGIIGKNGAGKSTLLKLLSHITAPTTGSIRYNGRIASLLEVGTGFHPEMTGRENIYMNGSIMGMTRAEITRKLDEIVDFAGVERYLDTPVKRYSSGMTVRLGFAVAAFLEPEILVVDEVLTVGDAEFQKKAIGKMQDVSSQGGRTVLFVSHNMDSIQNLCNTGILLENGTLRFQSNNINEVISHYLTSESSSYYYSNINSNIPVFVKKARYIGSGDNQKGLFEFNSCVELIVTVRRNSVIDPSTVMGINIETSKRTLVGIMEIPLKDLVSKEEISYKISYPSSILMPQNYIIHTDIHVPNVMFYERQDICSFKIFDNGSEFLKYDGTNNGILRLQTNIEIL